MRKTRFFILFVVCFIFSVTLSSEAENKTKARLEAPSLLQEGNTVGVIAPANSLTRYDIEMFEKGIKALENQGLNVIYREDLRERKYGALAGRDEVRAEEFMEMITNPEVKAIFTIAGGYGAMRILDHLDWETIRENPKIFVGFSDNTALHFALQSKAGFPSVHSTGVIFLWGNPQPRPYALEHLKALILAEDNDSISLSDWGGHQENAVDSIEVQTLNSGSASGQLIGGNLSLVSSMIGTPYEPDWDGKILFLEDVGEPLYKIDRMLTQIKLSGALDKLNGLILGRFVNIEGYDEEPDYTLEVVFDDLLGEYDYPIIYDFPVGHIRDNLPLPIGAPVRMSSKEPHLSISEDPFSQP